MNTSETSHRTYARVAGFTFLFYIVAGITSLALGSQMQVVNLLNPLLNLSALILAVTLFLLTSEQGPALALLAMGCRILEAVHDESEFFFVIGSTLFCWLLLRGRMIPIALAWLGVLASVLLDVTISLQLAGVFEGVNWSSSITWIVWLPMLVFEVALALWLIVKGVALPVTHNLISSQAN